MFYPKRTAKPLYEGLTAQCLKMGVAFIDALPSADSINTTFDVVVDALFGFSFKGDPRPPFDSVLAILSEITRPLVSVDIPSGMCTINTFNMYRFTVMCNITYICSMSLFGRGHLNGLHHGQKCARLKSNYSNIPLYATIVLGFGS